MTVGTPEVVRLLEIALDIAKKHRFGHVAVSLVGHPNVAFLDYAGDITLERGQREALGLLDAHVKKSIDNWTFPPQDKMLDASFVRYNVANGPLGYDFLIWLISAEMTRVREGAPAPLKVAFWLGHDLDQRVNQDRRRMWLENVFRPCLGLIGAVEDERALYGRCEEVFVPRDIVAAARRGEAVPRLRPRHPVTEHGAITITLREAAHGTARNSNIDAWLRFAARLRFTTNRSRDQIIFIRDTAKADNPLRGFRTDPRASRDLDYRMALYEGASINLFVSNGPSGLALFGSRPCLVFTAPDNGDTDEVCNIPEVYEKHNGIKMGEQWPWCRPDQRVVWKTDSYENIVTAFNETVAATAA